MPKLGTPEILILLLIIVMLFGAKRLPDAARGLGRSLRIFKAETKGLGDTTSTSATQEPAAPSAGAALPPAAPPAAAPAPVDEPQQQQNP